jgi:hypothetical protein
MLKTIRSIRPAQIVWGYWKEVLAIEEDAILMDVEYVEVIL